MLYFKKLTLAPIFLIFFTYFNYQALQIIQSSTNLIFSLSLNSLFELIIFTAVILASASFFIIFMTLAQDLKLVGPVAFLACLSPLIFSQNSQAIILMILFLASFAVIYLLLDKNLKTYITFNASQILVPQIKNLAKLLVLVVSLAYFFSIQTDINNKGFQIPDSLIDTAIKFSSPPELNQTDIPPTLTPDQLQLLKQNPDLLKQYGIDPKTLDQLTTSKSSLPAAASRVSQQVGSSDFAKNLIKNQVDKILQPYQSFIAPILALLFVASLYSLLSIIIIPLPLVIWLIFFILEKIGFIKFEGEMREVKKLVV